MDDDRTDAWSPQRPRRRAARQRQSAGGWGQGHKRRRLARHSRTLRPRNRTLDLDRRDACGADLACRRPAWDGDVLAVSQNHAELYHSTSGTWTVTHVIGDRG